MLLPGWDLRPLEVLVASGRLEPLKGVPIPAASSLRPIRFSARELWGSRGKPFIGVTTADGGAHHVPCPSRT